MNIRIVTMKCPYHLVLCFKQRILRDLVELLEYIDVDIPRRPSAHIVENGVDGLFRVVSCDCGPRVRQEFGIRLERVIWSTKDVEEQLRSLF